MRRYMHKKAWHLVYHLYLVQVESQDLTNAAKKQNLRTVINGTQSETMQIMRDVLWENGQVSDLQESLPVKMVSSLRCLIPLLILLNFTNFFA
jgi:hypothetical protein